MCKYDENSSDPIGIVGNMFGKLTVLSYNGHYRDTNNRFFYWYKVRCSCRAKTEFITSSRELQSGNTTGCKLCKRSEPILPGDVFGCLTVKEILPAISGKTHSRARCICNCPKHTEIIVNQTNLRTGITKTCGDSWHYIHKEYTGRLKLGRQPNSDIEVLEICETKRTKKGERIAICKCHHINPITEKVCGRIFETTVTNVLTGNTTTCGCAHNLYPDEKSRKLGQKWFAMRYRCNNESCEYYPDYGGRGIKVTTDWDETKEGRVKFIKDVLENTSFEIGQSIDRIKNDKGYELENIRFVGQTLQNNNKRNNHCVEVRGIKKTLSEWASSLHVNRIMLTNKMRFILDDKESEYIRRLIDHEITILDRVPSDLTAERVPRVDKGTFKSNFKFVINGIEKYDYEWEQDYGVTRGFIKRHVERGFTNEQIVHWMTQWKLTGGNPHIRRSDHNITVDGTTLNVTEWTKRLCISKYVLPNMIRHHSTEEICEYIRDKLKHLL